MNHHMNYRYDLNDETFSISYCDRIFLPFFSFLSYSCAKLWLGQGKNESLPLGDTFNLKVTFWAQDVVWRGSKFFVGNRHTTLFCLHVADETTYRHLFVSLRSFAPIFRF